MDGLAAPRSEGVYVFSHTWAWGLATAESADKTSRVCRHAVRKAGCSGQTT